MTLETPLSPRSAHDPELLHDLRQSHERIRLTFEHAPIGQAIVELDGRFREVNAAVCTLLGYSAQELTSMTFQDLTHPDDLQKDLALLDDLVAGEIASYDIEKRYFAAGGRTVWVQLAVALVRDEDGTPEYFIAQIQDITDRKKQTEALHDLVSMLAHDLRTPASLIDGYATLLAELGEDASAEETQDYLQRIRGASRAMNALLDNAMTASRSEAGQLQPVPEQVDLAGFVEDLLADLRPQVEAVTIEVAPGTTVWMDRGHLGQVLTNLVMNAVKYGGGRLRIDAEETGGQVRVRVCDDGPGVESEFVPHLFERFTRSRSARTGDKRGSGLGLFIVKDLTELNGGTVTYRPADGGGAEFVLGLPLAEAVAA